MNIAIIYNNIFLLLSLSAILFCDVKPDPVCPRTSRDFMYAQFAACSENMADPEGTFLPHKRRSTIGCSLACGASDDCSGFTYYDTFKQCALSTNEVKSCDQLTEQPGASFYYMTSGIPVCRNPWKIALELSPSGDGDTLSYTTGSVDSLLQYVQNGAQVRVKFQTCSRTKDPNAFTLLSADTVLVENGNLAAYAYMMSRFEWTRIQIDPRGNIRIAEFDGSIYECKGHPVTWYVKDISQTCAVITSDHVDVLEVKNKNETNDNAASSSGTMTTSSTITTNADQTNTGYIPSVYDDSATMSSQGSSEFTITNPVWMLTFKENANDDAGIVTSPENAIKAMLKGFTFQLVYKTQQAGPISMLKSFELNDYSVNTEKNQFNFTATMIQGRSFLNRMKTDIISIKFDGKEAQGTKFFDIDITRPTDPTDRAGSVHGEFTGYADFCWEKIFENNDSGDPVFGDFSEFSKLIDENGPRVRFSYTCVDNSTGTYSKINKFQTASRVTIINTPGESAVIKATSRIGVDMYKGLRPVWRVTNIATDGLVTVSTSDLIDSRFTTTTSCKALVTWYVDKSVRKSAWSYEKLPPSLSNRMGVPRISVDDVLAPTLHLGKLPNIVFVPSVGDENEIFYQSMDHVSYFLSDFFPSNVVEATSFHDMDQKPFRLVTVSTDNSYQVHVVAAGSKFTVEQDIEPTSLVKVHWFL